MRKREIYIENFNTNSIKNMAYEPVVYHGQQAFCVVILELSELSERCFLNDSSRRWWLLEFTLSVLEFASCLVFFI